MDASRQANLNSTVPVGAVLDFAGDTAPAGYLLCDGSTVSRTTYARLFAAISDKWGAGDGSTTFKLPDFRGRVLLGSGTGSGLTARSLAATGGAETHQLSSAEMPSHTHTQNSHNHTINDPGHNHGVRGTGAQIIGGGSGIGVNTASPVNQTTESNTTGITNSAATATNNNTGGDGYHNNMQPFAVTHKIIKY